MIDYEMIDYDTQDGQAGRQGAGMGAQRSARAASTPRPRVRARGRGRTYGHLVFVQLS